MSDAPQPQSPAAVVWPWRLPAGAAPSVAPARRRQALIESLVTFAVGLAILLIWKKPWLGSAVLVIGAAILSIGLCSARAYDAFLRGRQALARGVGVAMSWLLLAPFFYIFFTAGRVLQTAMRKDPMSLTFPTRNPTYWVPHKTVGGVERYRRQY